jgi:hypothetical protein
MKKFLMLAFSIVIVHTVFAQSGVQVLNLTPVVINVKTTWTPTTIYISAGDTFGIHVDGFASCSYLSATNNWNWYGPDGWGDYVAASGFPLQGVAAASVIGKIGSTGYPFFIGKNRIFKADSSGQLYLGFNDSGNYGDNSGVFVAYIAAKNHYLGDAVSEEADNTAHKYNLSQNYPNPFNPSTTIEYQIVKQGNVEVSIYDINGRLVKTLVNETQYPSSYTIQWNGRDESNRTVASGTYFYQVKSNGTQLVKKMLLLK